MKRTSRPSAQPISPRNPRLLAAASALSAFVLGGALALPALGSSAQTGNALDDTFADEGVAASLSNEFWSDPIGFVFGEETSGRFWEDPLGYIFGSGQPAELEDEAAAEELVARAAESFAGEVTGLERYHLSVSDLLTAYERLRATPEYDYICGVSYSYRNTSGDPADCLLTGFELEYLIDEADRPTYAADLAGAVAEVASLAQSRGGDGDVEKARAAYDILLGRCLGVSDSTSVSFTAYGCLVQGRAVGRGFADAYCLVMDALDIPCTVVVEADGGTAWNQVLVDGVWYNANLYWDSRLEEGDLATHIFFLCDDDALRLGGAKSWEGQKVPMGYGDLFTSGATEDRVAAAADAWRTMFDQGLESYGGVEGYRLTYAEVTQAFDLYLATDPYYDFVSRHGASYRLATKEDGSDGVVTLLTASYRLSPEQLAGYARAMHAGMDGLLAGVDRNADAYYQVLAVHDWIVANVVYDESLADPSYTAYGALVLGTAVCQGYSDLFQMAMDELGIPCERVVSLDMGHQWNMVCLDGQWYHIDVTWDDSVAGIGFWGDATYNFFLRSDESMLAQEHYGWTSEHIAPTDYQSW